MCAYVRVCTCKCVCNIYIYAYRYIYIHTTKQICVNIFYQKLIRTRSSMDEADEFLLLYPLKSDRFWKVRKQEFIVMKSRNSSQYALKMGLKVKICLKSLDLRNLGDY